MSTAAIPEFTVAPPSEFVVADSDLHARLFRAQDAPQLLKLAREGAVQRFVPWAKPIHDLATAERTIAWFNSTWDRGVMARYAIEKNGEFVGYCGLWRDQAPGYYEFGFAMLPEFRGQGLGTLIVSQLVALAKTRLRAKGIIAYINDANDASRSVAAKLGLQPTDEFDAGDRRYRLDFSS